MGRVFVERDAIRCGEHMLVSFQRTVRVPLGAREFPLPPSFGRFPVSRLGGEDTASIEVALPMLQLEALWIGFEGDDWPPHAVMVGAGGVNALTGEPWEERLSVTPQNYLVCPDQSWLDGINAGEGFVRQFVATPLGSGLSVEEQLGTPAPKGGIRIAVFAPRPGRLPAHVATPAGAARPPAGMPADAGLMSLGAGGKITQKIYPDPYGLDVWEAEPFARANVLLLNSEQYRDATGRDAPRSPLDAQTYARLGLPWFELYEEDRADLPPSRRLAGVKTVGRAETEDEDTDPGSLRVRRLGRDTSGGDS